VIKVGRRFAVELVSRRLAGGEVGRTHSRFAKRQERGNLLGLFGDAVVGSCPAGGEADVFVGFFSGVEAEAASTLVMPGNDIPL
jgi:hypothetical protein